jgi:hypothetical protein
MGLFDFFKKPAKVQDEVFGEMTIEKGLINAACLFLPLNAIIECNLESNENGPTDDQRAFYKSIEQNYSQLRAKIVPIMQDTFRNWKEDFEIIDFDKEFTLTYISLPAIDSKPVQWEISYTSVHDLNHNFNIIVNDLTPENDVAVDG